MPAAYLKAISASSAPAQFCASVPYPTRRIAAAVLRRGKLRADGRIYRCTACNQWHIRPRANRRRDVLGYA